MLNRIRIAGGILVVMFSAVASGATPTTEQILQQFKNLPPEQRRELLEAVSGARARELASESAEGREIGVTEITEEFGPEALFEFEEARFEPETTVVIQFEIPEEIDIVGEELEQLELRRLELVGGNPYQLDRLGRLHMPGKRAIDLAGLTVEEATRRLEAEHDLLDFDVRVTMLPLAPTGTRALEPFGYRLFEDVPSTFAPVTDIPVPSDYVIGPGDTILVQLFGSVSAEYEFTVTRDGTITFPDVGPVVVSGLTLHDLQDRISTAVSEQLIGTRANVTMGKLRSLHIFVLGDAVRPGSYTVGGLSTIANALFASGGPDRNGSMRSIQLKRDGSVVARLDLYDLLLRGDTRNDIRLQSGDVIFIPPIGATVGVEGEVRRPAIYELRNEQTIRDLVRLAGGLSPQADPKSATLERIAHTRERTVIDVDLTENASLAARIRTGDMLRIPAILDEFEDTVSVDGYVYRPGRLQWYPGIRLADVIGSVKELRPAADLNYLVIRRERAGDRRISVVSADLEAALAAPGSAADVPLQARDQILVLDVEEHRQRLLTPIIEELHRQSQTDDPAQVVNVSGQVRSPGEYPLSPQMRVSDLLRAGAQLQEDAYALEAELTRYSVIGGQFREVDLIDIDLSAVLNGVTAADVYLQPHDFLSIKEIPQWREQERIEIIGEVQFPGVYPIKRGETLSSVLNRAGGLTELSFPDGSIFTREDLKRREKEQLNELAKRLESDLTSLALSEGGSPQALTLGQSLLQQLREAEPVGRLVIDVDRIIASDSNAIGGLILKDGDRLYIPQQTQVVTVLGEVQYATSHLHETGLSRNDYIDRSGGLTNKADKKRIYVVRANGGVLAEGGSKWFRSGRLDISAGDTIVVPLETDRIRPLSLWTQVTQVIFNLAVAVSAINSF